jgi:hypothetical protein
VTEGLAIAVGVKHAEFAKMSGPIRVLLQSSISYAPDDWHVGRFSLLRDQLAGVADVVARNREPDEHGDDPVLSSLSRADFDEVWLLAVDGGDGVSRRDLDGINAFQRAGGGLLTARDHQNMGLWLRGLDGIGQAHFFHRPEYCEPEPDRLCPDDRDTPAISWPNYHSGRNGDVQPLALVEPLHPLLRHDDLPGGRVELFPSHPHEGAVRPPADEPRARALARGRSTVTGHTFDLVVAFERTAAAPGRAIAESSFHHFADYNWDIDRGAPTFVSEPPGDGIRRDPRALDHVRAYVKNAVAWLAP